MTSSQNGVLLDVRAPRHFAAPEGDRAGGREAVELAASAGLVLDPWQALALEVGCSEQPDGRWSAFEVGLVVTRQNGKGSILEARELAGLFLFGEQLILHSAHEFKTAAEAFRRVLSLIQSCPDLDSQVVRVRTSHGEEGIEVRGGGRLRFVARSTGSGRGFSGDCVILDEAYNLSNKAMAALLPTMAARPNPQLWYTSSAPLDGAESDVLRRLCKRGRAGESPSLAYLEWSADPAKSPDDPETWAQANPSFGIRISADFVRNEKAALDPVDFARERLGIWSEDEGKADVIPADKWDACLDTDSEAGAVEFALDVSPDSRTASIAAAGRRSDGLIHVEVVEARGGTAWVVERVAELVARHGGRVHVDPKGPTGALLEPLAEANVEVVEVSLTEHQQACGAFLDDVLNNRLRHIGQPELDAAIAAAVRREVGDAWLWSRKKSAADISPLVAVGIARWAAAQRTSDESEFFTL